MRNPKEGRIEVLRLRLKHRYAEMAKNRKSMANANAIRSYQSDHTSNRHTTRTENIYRTMPPSFPPNSEAWVCAVLLSFRFWRYSVLGLRSVSSLRQLQELETRFLAIGF